MTSNHDNLATLASVTTEVEAQLLVNMLNDHDIAAVATGGFTSQFQAEAPGVVRVLVKQKDLAVARSALAEREQDHCPSELADENAESSAYESRLTRFGIWSLLVLELFSIVGIMAAWGMGLAGVSDGIVGLVVSVVLVAAIMTRWWLKRTARNGPAVEC